MMDAGSDGREGDSAGSSKRPKLDSSNPSQRRPLARGDACNTCRTRKIRCPGERPVCANCAKRSRTCVYSEKRYMLSGIDDLDIGEIKIPGVNASSNGVISNGASPSTKAYSARSTPASHTHTPTSAPPGPSDGSHFPPPIYAAPGSEVTPLPAPLGPDMSLVGQYTNPLIHDGFSVMFPFSGFLGLMGGSPTGLTGQILPPQYANLDLDQLLRQLEKDVVAGQAGAATENQPPPTMQPPQPVPVELSDAEKEHLLWLYFSHQRMFCLEMHFATFWERLHNEDPKQRPHDCLLNAIYLVTCWASPSPVIRVREAEFQRLASEELHKAIADVDRLLDAVRAGFLLSCWLYSKCRFTEGASVAGTAVQVAIMCGLHIIPRSRYMGEPDLRKGILRYSFTYLEKPTSQIDLADRIHTFWSIFLIDRSAAVSQDWPSGFNIDRVCTPLPRPWSEYEEGGEHLENDETLFDLMQGLVPVKQATELGQTLKALEILYRSTQLGLSFPKQSFSAQRYDGVWGRGRKARGEKENLLHALEKFTEQLPPYLKLVQFTKDGKSVSTATGTMQFLIGASLQYIHDTDTFGDTNELAMVATRRMLGVMHLLGEQDDSFDSGLLVIMIWARIGNLLIREYLRLEDMGDSFAAANVDSEIQFVISSLRVRGRRCGLAELQAEELVAYRADPEQFNPGCRKRDPGMNGKRMSLGSVRS